MCHGTLFWREEGERMICASVRIGWLKVPPDVSLNKLIVNSFKDTEQIHKATQRLLT